MTVSSIRVLLAASLLCGLTMPLQAAAPTAPVTAEQLRLPGMSWESLSALPAFTGIRWIPDGAPADERAYLRQIKYPPLKAEYLADAKLIVASMLAGDVPLPTSTCNFDGMPHAAWYPYPLQFVYAAGYVNILAHDVIRSTPVSGASHPQQMFDKDQLRSYDLYGSSAGTWEGDTLVIDTLAAREDMDTFYGIPNDPDLHVVERYRLIGKDRLERRTRIEAPTYFTGPWEIRTTYRRTPEQSWATRFCLPEKTTAATRPSIASPAPASARFTPNLTWPEILALPKIWGVNWSSSRAHDEQVVYVTRITLIPPLKPEFMATYRRFLERSREGKAEFKTGTCYPNGVPRSGWFAYPPGFLFRPGNSVLVTSWGETREVYMDGRAHPATDSVADPARAYLGHSLGWWEGNTLVIDTVGFAPEHELFYDVPNSGKMHVIERYRLLDSGFMELVLTVEDPERLEKPWVIQRTYQPPNLPDSTQRSQGGMRLDTMRCRPGLGREQLDASGKSFVDLTPPPEGLGIGKQPNK